MMKNILYLCIVLAAGAASAAVLRVGPGAENAARPGWIHTSTLAAADDYFTARGASSWRDVLVGSDGWRPFYFRGGLQTVAK